MPKAKSAAATAEKKTSTRSKKASTPTTAAPSVQVTKSVNEEQIRMRAYQLYETRGRKDGAHESDWFAAESELRTHTS